MKKKGLIIASLLVLVMSFMFLGCDGDPKDEGEEEVTYNPTVSQEALAALADVWTGTLKVPANTNFGGFHSDKTGTTQATYVAIWWKDADVEKYKAYEAAWNPSTANVVEARTINYGENWTSIKDKTGKFATIIGFTTAGGDEYDGETANTGNKYTVPANCIVFTIY